MARRIFAQQLIEKMRTRTGLSTSENKKIVETFIDMVADAIAKGNDVQIKNFGTFRYITRENVVTRNVVTGESLDPISTAYASFKSSPHLKGKIKENVENESINSKEYTERATVRKTSKVKPAPKTKKATAKKVSTAKPASETKKVTAKKVSTAKPASETKKVTTKKTSTAKPASKTKKATAKKVSTAKPASETKKVTAKKVSTAKPASETKKVTTKKTSTAKPASETKKVTAKKTSTTTKKKFRRTNKK